MEIESNFKYLHLNKDIQMGICRLEPTAWILISGTANKVVISIKTNDETTKM